MPINTIALHEYEYLYINNTEPVTYYRRLTDASGFDGGTAVANAFRPLRDREYADGTKAKDTDSILVWLPQVGTPYPKQGDVILDKNSIRWSVVKVEVQAWGARFLCSMVKERV